MNQKRLSLAFIVVYILIWVSGEYSKKFTTDLFAAPVKKNFTHDEFVKLKLWTNKKAVVSDLSKKTLKAFVKKNGEIIKTIGGKRHLNLRYNPTRGIWEGRWPCPWNTQEGTYEICLDTGTTQPYLKILTAPFSVIRIKRNKVKPGIGVLTLENLTALSKLRMRAPDGSIKNWEAIIDWAEFIGADAIWLLSGETSNQRRKYNEDFPWTSRYKSNLKAFGKECHRRGIKLGTYVMVFLTNSMPEVAPDYKYAWEYTDGELIDGSKRRGRRSVSISDKKRVKDLIKIIKDYAALPEVDHLGLDYIRNALGGYELVDMFAEDMEIDTPAGWEDMDFKDRMLWFAKKKVARKDENLLDQWQWWRAHTVANIVRQVKNAIGEKKPLWTFTLTWKKGWQHGQDPIMMNAAGADMDSLMLYEADKEQYDTLIKDWNEYVKIGQVNLIAGNIVDWPLHQRSINPAGPEEYLRRLILAIDHLYSDGYAPGVFIHDIARALRGRIAPYSSREWLLCSGAAITYMRRVNNLFDYTVALDFPDRVKNNSVIPCSLNFGSLPENKKFNIKFYGSPGIWVYPNEMADISASAINDTEFKVYTRDSNVPERGNRHFISAVITVVGETDPRLKKQIFVKYFNK